MFTITASEIKNVPDGISEEELQETIDFTLAYLRRMIPNLMSLDDDGSTLAKGFIIRGISQLIQPDYCESGSWSAGPFSEDNSANAKENPLFPRAYLDKLFALCGIETRFSIINLHDKFTKPGWEEHIWLVDDFGDN